MRNAMSAFQLCAESQKKDLKTQYMARKTLMPSCQKQNERFNPCNKNDNYTLEINTLFLKSTTTTKNKITIHIPFDQISYL